MLENTNKLYASINIHNIPLSYLLHFDVFLAITFNKFDLIKH